MTEDELNAIGVKVRCGIEVTTHEDVQRVAAIQEPKMTLIMKTLISEI